MQLSILYDEMCLAPLAQSVEESPYGATCWSHAEGGSLTLFMMNPNTAIRISHSEPVASLPFRRRDPSVQIENRRIRLDQVLLVSSALQTIPVRIDPIQCKLLIHPQEFSLQQNFPNPFNSTTDIGYQISDIRSSVHTTLRICNILGQEVRTLVDEVQEPGFYSATWNGKDDDGRGVPSGVYFYHLQVEGLSQTKRMILLQ